MSKKVEKLSKEELDNILLKLVMELKAKDLLPAIIFQKLSGSVQRWH